MRIALILVLAWLLGRVLRSIIKRIERISDDGDPTTASEIEKRAQTIGRILRQASSLLVWSLTLMLVLGEFGVDLKPILAGAGILGLAAGFGAQTLVNVATVKPLDSGKVRPQIVLRRPPPRTGPQIKAYLENVVAAFNARTGACLTVDGYWEDEPLSLDPEAKLAKRLPNSIAFGMWFPGMPYPGHDVDERIPIGDLHRGTHVRIADLADIACGPRIDRPFDR